MSVRSGALAVAFVPHPGRAVLTDPVLRTLRRAGLRVARPTVGLPAPGGADVVHLLSPPVPAGSAGPARLLMGLRGLVASGAIVVQTVSALEPGGHSSRARRLVADLDALSHGAHLMSHEHDALARRHRPELPAARLVSPPPRPFVTDSGPPPTPAPGVLGCCAPVGPDGRVLRLARAFRQHATADQQLLLTGPATADAAADALRAVLAQDLRITWRPTTRDPWRPAVERAGWLALARPTVYAGTDLLAALDAGRWVLGPRPVGADALGASPTTGIYLSSWDDDVALRRWAAVASAWTPGGLAPSPRPTWEHAAVGLAGFYRDLRAGATLPLTPPSGVAVQPREAGAAR